MRILHVGVGNLGPGGVATYVRWAIDAQRRRGHDVMLSELWPGPASMPEVQEFLYSQEATVALQERFAPDVTHLHSQLPEYGTLRMPAVITAHDHSAHCPSGARYLSGPGKACEREFGLLNCLRGHLVDRCGSRDPRAMVRRFGVTAATPRFRGHWIAPSRYTGEWLAKRRIPADRLHVLGNPQTNREVPDGIRPSTGPVVLFLGRLFPNKGCDVLLEAMTSLPETASLRVVGDGSSRSDLEARAAALGLSERVRFLGWQTPEQVRGHLAQARVLAVPSRWPEPFGLVALEAYAAECPVVASRVGGLLDLVLPGRTGELVEPGSAEALAGGLRGFLADEGAARDAGRAGREWALARFPPEGHLEDLERIYALATRESP